MPKKEWTDAERKAFGDKMRASRAAKVAANNLPDTPQAPEPVQPPEAKETISVDDYTDLVRQIQELKASMWDANRPTSATNQPQVGNGKLVGTLEKYSTDPGSYPDPTEQLKDEARLKQFAFKENYDLKYTVTTSSYTTIDNVRTVEPKFTLDLIRIIRDELTGEKTDGRYTVCRIIMHEDPDLALMLARENGIQVDENDEATFLNDMRYLRLRDWLLECFFPPIPQSQNNKKEMVVGGKLVDYFEVNSEVGSAKPPINFGQLNRKA